MEWKGAEKERKRRKREGKGRGEWREGREREEREEEEGEEGREEERSTEEKKKMDRRRDRKESMKSSSRAGGLRHVPGTHEPWVQSPPTTWLFFLKTAWVFCVLRNSTCVLGSPSIFCKEASWDFYKDNTCCKVYRASSHIKALNSTVICV